MEDLSSIKEKILNYQLKGSNLGNLGYTRILLQFCGNTGHGKSSLINSFKYAFHGGKFSELAPVATADKSHGGCTMQRIPYELTEVITLVDNRGFGKADSFEEEEVYAQLANIQPMNENVKWNWTFEERAELVTTAGLNTCDLLVPVFVYSVQAQIYEDMKDEILEFLKNAQKFTGFLPIIVLTKKLSGNAKKMHEQFEEMGMENIYKVENYTIDNCIKSPGKDKTFLTVMSSILDLVDFVANNVVPSMDTPEKEHQKRVQMLLRMAKDNAIKREKIKWMKENEQPKKEKVNCLIL